MKNILVPMDFSKPAIDAFRFALSCARQSGGQVHLLHIIELPVVTDSMLFPVVYHQPAYQLELRGKADLSFSSIIRKYNVEGLEVKKSVSFGPTTMTIIDHIRETGCDIVIMGSHGSSNIRELVIGSNAEKVIRNSPVPVLVVKELNERPISNIVFPCGLEKVNASVLIGELKRLQDFFKAHLHIVWINTPGNFVPDSIVRAQLEQFVKTHSLTNASVYTFSDFNEMDGILAFCKIVEGDIIAMGTHGRRGIAHSFYGSLTEDVVNHAPKLIWTFSLRAGEKVPSKRKMQQTTKA